MNVYIKLIKVCSNLLACSEFDYRTWLYDGNVVLASRWPKYDENWLVENEVEIVVQINGKVKAKLVIPADADREQMQELALEDEQVKAAMDGKSMVVGISLFFVSYAVLSQAELFSAFMIAMVILTVGEMFFWPYYA